MQEDADLHIAVVGMVLTLLATVAAHDVLMIRRRRRLTGKARFRDRLHAMRKMDEIPEKEFKRMFRLDLQTFQAVLKKIERRLERPMPERAKARGDALPPKLMLACALRFLAGGSYLDICFGLEISRCSRRGADNARPPPPPSARAARAPRGRDHERPHLSALGALFGSTQHSRAPMLARRRALARRHALARAAQDQL